MGSFLATDSCEKRQSALCRVNSRVVVKTNSLGQVGNNS